MAVNSDVVTGLRKQTIKAPRARSTSFASGARKSEAQVAGEVVSSSQMGSVVV